MKKEMGLFALGALVAVVFFGATNTAYGDGPFGVSMGKSKSQIEELAGGALKETENPGTYEGPAPKPHSKFKTYYFVIAPKAGLCQVRAITDMIKTSRHGIQLKSEFQDLEGAIEGAYGKHRTYDRLLPGSIWNEPEDWMMALLQKERALQGAWDEEEKSSLKNDIQQILLTAVGLSSDTGAIALQYTFSNFDACEKEIAAKDESVL